MPSDRAEEILAEACGAGSDWLEDQSPMYITRDMALRAVRAALADHACPVPEDYGKALAEIACARDVAERELAEARSLLDPRIALAALSLVENAERHPEACCSKCAAGLAERDEALAALQHCEQDRLLVMKVNKELRAAEQELRAEIARLGQCEEGLKSFVTCQFESVPTGSLRKAINIAWREARAALGIEVKPKHAQVAPEILSENRGSRQTEGQTLGSAKTPTKPEKEGR